uniref:D12 class N6 adenine-specific DNA methyltransferase n=1 Tax=Mycobacterium riyadhense TaxID=486698 RepID=A0A653EWF4_9MYCO|nr:hypothetical protein BIN_B_04197 [Mycobacterium riyadhense]
MPAERWVRLSQGRSATLRKTGWRHHIDPAGSSLSVPGYLAAYIDRMGAAAQRLHRVSLECRPAIEVIASYGGFPAVCLYVDPPYLGSTRSRNYRTEMAAEDEHAQLLDSLLAAQASVVISGYPNALYDDALSNWDRVEIPSGTSQGGAHAPRTEVLWSNRPISNPTLFDPGSAI